MSFTRTAGCCRFVWNWALAQRRALWHAVRDLPEERRREALRSACWAAQDAQLKPLKAQFPFLAEAPAHALQQVLRDLDRAYQAFFSGRAGFPAFKRKGHHDAFRESDPACFALNGQAVKLPKVGWVPMRRSQDVDGDAKQVTVSRDGEHWFVAIQTERHVAEPSPPAGAAVGIDLGVAQTITCSDGVVHQLPVASAAEQHRIARLQRRVSCKRRGSKNRAKALRRFARARRRIVNRVRNAIHHATTALAKNHGLVVVEDLAVRSLTASARGSVEAPGRQVRQKAGLNRAILERSWSEIRRQLTYKCAWSGARLVAVPPAYTSQRCHQCGWVAAGNRPSQAVFRCTTCGHTAHADVNAAQNILAAGLAVAACGAPDGRVEAGICLKGTA